MTRESTPTSLVTQGSGPLIAVFAEEDGEDSVRYFIEEPAADAATTDAVIEAALATIGAWSDLDWDELADDLDRIRHESRPTPPIEL
jgi:hypothetical protein